MKNKMLTIVEIVLIVALITIAVLFVAMSIKVQKADRESKIEKEIKAELIRQATDDGEDGDEYIVFLFPASAAYTEVSKAGGKYFLSYIIGSGTDDEGEWQLVKYEPNGNIRTYDIP